MSCGTRCDSNTSSQQTSPMSAPVIINAHYGYFVPHLQKRDGGLLFVAHSLMVEGEVGVLLSPTSAMDIQKIQQPVATVRTFCY